MEGGLRGGLFGFNRKDVRRILADRERMFVAAVRETQILVAKLDVLEREIEPLRTEAATATDRADRAESQVQTLDGELRPLRDDLAAKEHEIAVLRGHVEELRASVDRLRGEVELAREDPLAFLGASGDLPVQLLIAEIAPILQSAQESAARLIEDARRHSQDQLSEVVRIRDEVRGHVGQISAWRAQLEPMVEGVRSGLSEARAKINDVPNRVHEALVPLADLIGDLAEQLDRFAEAVEPPDVSINEPDVIDLERGGPAEPTIIERRDPPDGKPADRSDPRVSPSYVDSRILAAVPPTLRRYWLPHVGSGESVAR